MTNFIYALSDPRDNQIRYIGKTDNLSRRFKMHLTEKYKSYKCNWIKSLLSINLKPNMLILESVPVDKDWESREIYWIQFYREQGCNLTNMTDGGDQGPNCTGKHLIKSAQGKQNIINALIKRNKSPENRTKVSKANKGKPHRKNTPEEIEQKRKWMTGKKIHTEEFKSRLAERNKIRKNDPKIMSVAIKKSWQDPETRKRYLSNRAKLTEQQVKEIRTATNISPNQLAKKYGVSNTLIRKIINYKCWKHI